MARFGQSEISSLMNLVMASTSLDKENGTSSKAQDGGSALVLRANLGY